MSAKDKMLNSENKKTESKGVSVKTVAELTATGVSMHSKRAGELIEKLISYGKGSSKDSLKNPEKLKKLAAEFGIIAETKNDKEIALELGNKILSEFKGKSTSELIFSKRAPKKQVDFWKNLGIIPKSVEKEISETILKLNSVSNPDDAALAPFILRTALAEGWGSAMIETSLSDILYGPPQITKKSIDSAEFITGFTEDNIPYSLGGKFRASLVPLLDNIVNGRIRGVAALAGCDNPSANAGANHLKIAKELIKNDVLVLITGKSFIESSKAGLLKPEAAFEFAGAGLKEVCKAVGIPPVIHIGGCADNSRILLACTGIVKTAGLNGIDELPIAGASFDLTVAEMMPIGWYFVASGALVVFGAPSTIIDSINVVTLITKDIENLVGGKWAFEPDPLKAAHMMISHIDKKRSALKLAPMMYSLISEVNNV